MGVQVRVLWAGLATSWLLTSFSPAQTPASQPADLSALTGVARLRAEAALLAPLLDSPVTDSFLAATAELPAATSRTVYRNRGKNAWCSAAAYEELPEAQRAGYAAFPADENFYYCTGYGSPLVYGRVLDLAGQHGFAGFDGARVLDFGCGAIGHLRLMALRGADVVGVDPGDMLSALYDQPEDQGPFPTADAKGRVTLVHERWPAEPTAVRRAGRGFRLITSKNTLKNGYIHPAEEVDPRWTIELGVADAAFVAALYESLAPGGVVVIYNLCPPLSKPGEKYIPWSDGRCPFPREMLTKAGFEVLAYDVSDDERALPIFSTLGYPTHDEQGAATVYSLYTIFRRPA